MKLFLIAITIIITYISFAFSFVAPNQFLDEIAIKLHLNSLLALSPITTIITFSKIIAPFLSIYIIRYVGIHIGFMISILFISLSIITPFSSTYTVFLLSRFFLGVGGSLFAVYMHPIVAYYFKNKTKIFLNGSTPVSFHIGSTVAINFSIMMAAYFGNFSYPLLIGSSLAVTSLFLASITMLPDIYSHLRQQKISKPNLNFSFLEGIKDPFTLLVSFVGSGAIAGFIIIVSFYFKLKIPNLEIFIDAGFIAGITGLFLAPLWKQSYLSVLRICGLFQIIGLTGLSFISNPLINLIFAIITGMSISFPAPFLFAYIHQKKKYSIEQLTNTMGVFWCLTYTVTTIASTIFSRLVDINHENLTIPLIFNIIIVSFYFIGSSILKDDSLSKGKI